MFRTWRVVGSIEVIDATIIMYSAPCSSNDGIYMQAFESSFPSAFDDNTIIEKIGLMLVRGRMDL
jgi:hypothetical protein